MVQKSPILGFNQQKFWCPCVSSEHGQPQKKNMGFSPHHWVSSGVPGVLWGKKWPNGQLWLLEAMPYKRHVYEIFICCYLISYVNLRFSQFSHIHSILLKNRDTEQPVNWMCFKKQNGFIPLDFSHGGIVFLTNNRYKQMISLFGTSISTDMCTWSAGTWQPQL